MSFGVRELTAEILEAGIIVQGCWQGSKLRVAYIVSRGWAISKRGRNIEKKKRSGRIEESFNSIFLGKKGKVL